MHYSKRMLVIQKIMTLIFLKNTNYQLKIDVFFLRKIQKLEYHFGFQIAYNLREKEWLDIQVLKTA
jgi:hypothetical protein